jgi:glucose/arabinose dehydrogenase
MSTMRPLSAALLCVALLVAGAATAAAATVAGHAAATSFKLAITVVGNGRGRVTVSPAAESYPAGTVVTLTAVASGRNAFLGWQQGIAAEDSRQTSVNVLMTADLAVVARFEVSGLDPVPERIALSPLAVEVVDFAALPSSLPNAAAPGAAAAGAGYAPRARINHFSPLRDGSGRNFVVDQRGRLYLLGADGVPGEYLDLPSITPRFTDWPGLTSGLNAVAVAPDFARSGRFYTVHAETPGPERGYLRTTVAMPVGAHFVLTEWTASDPAAGRFAGKRREVLRLEGPDPQHGLQDIGFEPGLEPGAANYGMLFLLVGEGTSVWRGNARSVGRPDSLFGAVLRIDPLGTNGRGGTYGVPADNPFFGRPAADGFPEVWAYGFRNPHKLSFDPAHQGWLYVSDVGESNLEEVNLVLPGRHYGWPQREGTWQVDPAGVVSQPQPPPAADASAGLMPPVAQFDHDEGTAVSGGFVYRGRGIPQLQGQYVFGDIGGGRVFVFDTREVALGRQATVRELRLLRDGKPTTLAQLTGSARVDLHFGVDQGGELYLLTKSDGRIRRLAAPR